MVHVLTCLAAMSLAPPQFASSTQRVPVTSWYDAGIRLRPVCSWYDSGTRLVAWSRPMLYSNDAVVSFGFDAELSCPKIGKLVIKQHIGVGTQGEVMIGELPGIGRRTTLKLGLQQNAIDRKTLVLSAISGADSRGDCIVRPDCPKDDA